MSSSQAEPVIAAAASGQLEEVQRLIDERPESLACTDSEGASPLMRAAEAGHLEVVRLLLERGAPWNQQVSSTWLRQSRLNDVDGNGC